MTTMVQPISMPISMPIQVRVPVPVPVPDPNRMCASSETWERHKPEITRLYREKTLKEVMEHMQSVHGFYATERMYKFRIKSWGLRKNWKEDRVRRVLETLDGKTLPNNGDGGVAVAGDQLEILKAQQLRRLEQFLRRKPTALEQLPGEHKAALERLLRQFDNGGVVKDGSTVTWPRKLRPLAPTPAPSAIRGPTQVEVPDEILRLLGTFLDCMKSNRPKKHPKQDERMLEFVLKFRLAHSLIVSGHQGPAFLCLHVCFDFLSATLLPEGHPMTFLFVLNAALEVSTDFGVLPGILYELFKYLHELAEIRLGKKHPATEISRRFLVLAEQGEECKALLAAMRRLRTDNFSTGIVRGEIEEGGEEKEVAFSVYDKTVEVWSASQERQHQHQQDRVSMVAGLQRLLTEWELVNQSFIMTLWMRMRTAIAILDEQGEAGLTAIGEMLKKNYDNELLIGLREPARLSLVLQCYRIRGYMWLRDGMVKNAEYMFWMGRILAEATWGKGCEVAVGFREDERKLAEILRIKGGKVTSRRRSGH